MRESLHPPAMHQPIATMFHHSGAVVHIFAPPLGDDQPDAPWVELAELVRCCCVPREVSTAFLSVYRRDWAAIITNVSTTDGPKEVTAWAGAGPAIHALLNAMAEEGLLRRDAAQRTFLQIATAMLTATNNMLDNQGITDDAARVQWSELALHRWDHVLDLKPGGSVH